MYVPGGQVRLRRSGGRPSSKHSISFIMIIIISSSSSSSSSSISYV